MPFKRALLAFTLAAYLWSISGCGVLLYPERQGQTDGKIDPAVLILDGIGLFFYVIPGLVAFAVDFYQGTIYLPNTSASIDGDSPMRAVKVDGAMTEENIEAALERELGRAVDITGERVQVREIERGMLGMVPEMAAAQRSTRPL